MHILLSLFQPIYNPQTGPDSVTRWICLAILAFVALFIWTRNSRRFLQSITTVLGILGTFLGIYLGLMNFDANDIEQSVPPLLAGLKTAFLTSIFGIGATLLTRIIDRLALTFQPAERSTEGATVETLAELLAEQTQTLRDNHGQTLESLDSIRASVSGEDDTSMLTQVQKLRTTFTDKQDELVREFRTFAEKMAEANSESLIRALEEVMRDFNAKINEQFGDNFKQLNEGVGKLVDWQDKYAEQTETMIAQFRATAAAISSVRDSVAQIGERSRNITKAAEKLEPVLAGIQEQRQDMENYLARFAEMAEKAEQLLPTLNAKVNTLTEDFSRAVGQATEANRASLDAQKELVSTVTENFSALGQQTSEAVAEVEKSVKQHFERMDAHVEDAAKRHEEVAANLAGRLDAQITETFTKTSQEIERLVEQSMRSAEAKINELTENFSRAVGQATEANLQFLDVHRESLDAQKELVGTVTENFSALGQQTSEAVAEVEKSVKQHFERMDAHVEDAAKRHEEVAANLAGRLDTQITETFTKAAQEIERLAQESARNTEERMREIDKGLGEELSKVLRELGSRLASISEKFADDYGPLADNLREVQEIVRRGQGRA